jgi:ribosome-binding factor A
MSYRLEKFASTLQQALGEILNQESLNPDFKRASVVRVQLARDLKRATVFIACPAGAEESILKQLAGASGFLKKQLGKKMILRHMPELDFVVDTALDLENRLDLLIPQGDNGPRTEQSPRGTAARSRTISPGDGGPGTASHEDTDR